jgi:hypothetical protein
MRASLHHLTDLGIQGLAQFLHDGRKKTRLNFSPRQSINFIMGPRLVLYSLVMAREAPYIIYKEGPGPGSRQSVPLGERWKWFRRVSAVLTTMDDYEP